MVLSTILIVHTSPFLASGKALGVQRPAAAYRGRSSGVVFTLYQSFYVTSLTQFRTSATGLVEARGKESEVAAAAWYFVILVYITVRPVQNATI